MVVTPIKTARIRPGGQTLFDLLDGYLAVLDEKTVVVITSKIVSLCEGRIAPTDKRDKLELVNSEAEYYYPAHENKYRHHFTITRKTILGASGIDESNGGGYYVLLPDDVQRSANTAREHLRTKRGLKDLGVIITDSASLPLRVGAMGTCLAYSGFTPVNDYRGQKDLFGRQFRIEKANMAEGLAAAAVAAMGEGDEQTPLCLVSDNPLIRFCDNDPSDEELGSVFLSLEEDLFAPFFNNGQWRPGARPKK